MTEAGYEALRHQSIGDFPDEEKARRDAGALDDDVFEREKRRLLSG